MKGNTMATVKSNIIAVKKATRFKQEETSLRAKEKDKLFYNASLRGSAKQSAHAQQRKDY